MTWFDRLIDIAIFDDDYRITSEYIRQIENSHIIDQNDGYDSSFITPVIDNVPKIAQRPTYKTLHIYTCM